MHIIRNTKNSKETAIFLSLSISPSDAIVASYARN